MDKELKGKLKYLINKKKDFAVICEELELKDYEVIGLVMLMKQDGDLVDYIDGQIVKLTKPIQTEGTYHVPHNLERLRLLLISDTHLGSTSDRLDILRYVYDKADKRGVQHILHSGDLFEGISNRPEQVYERRMHSYDDMLQYGVDNYPSYSGKTYAISGNHDDWMIKQGSGEIIRSLARQREDIVYLGPSVADMQIGKTKIRLFHGQGKVGYAVSYKMERYLDAIPMAERPHILQMGHIHRAFYAHRDETHCFQTSALQDETAYTKSLGLPNSKSCWWVDVNLDDKGRVASIVPELETFGPKLVKKRR